MSAQLLAESSAEAGERWRQDALPAAAPSGPGGPSSGVVTADARHDFVALAESRGSRVRVLDADRAEIARAERPDAVWGLFIDADGRRWVRTVPTGDDGTPTQLYRLFDGTLGPLGEVRLDDVLDAWGDYVVILEIDDLGARRLRLLRGPVPGGP